MEDLWRVPFTIMIGTIMFLCTILYGFSGFLLSYLWTGFCVWIVLECRCNLIKILVLWLPGLWFEGITEYIVK